MGDSRSSVTKRVRDRERASLKSYTVPSRCEAMIDPSDVILVGLQQSVLNEALQARVRPEQYLLDLERSGDGGSRPNEALT